MVGVCITGTVKVWEQGPPDGVVNVTLDMPKADFLKVYSGTASAKAVTGMVLSGRLYVHGWKFGALKHFANSFDYSSECWERFYAARDAEAAAKEQAEAEAKAKAEAEAEAEAEAAAAAAAEKAAALAATHGHTSISMPLAAAKQQVRCVVAATVVACPCRRFDPHARCMSCALLVCDRSASRDRLRRASCALPTPSVTLRAASWSVRWRCQAATSCPTSQACCLRLRRRPCHGVAGGRTT